MHRCNRLRDPLGHHSSIREIPEFDDSVGEGVIEYFGAVELLAGELDDLVGLVESVAHYANFLVDGELVDQEVLGVLGGVVGKDLQLDHVAGDFPQEIGAEHGLP